MKKLLFILTCSLTASVIHPARLRAQTQEAQQLILNYEKLLALEKILDNMYKGYRILTKGYNTIRDLAEGNFKLHQVFLDGLYAVSPAVQKYKRIPLIIQYQQQLIREYKAAFDRFKNDENLTVREIRYIENVYRFLSRQSLHNLEELLMIITAGKLRMSDDERLRAIDRIGDNMEDQLAFLKVFNASTLQVTRQRAAQHHDVTTSQKLHDIAP